MKEAWCSRVHWGGCILTSSDASWYSVRSARRTRSLDPPAPTMVPQVVQAPFTSLDCQGSRPRAQRS
ncbi:hypothetical protein BEK98_29555 [Streptomyces diastatochromogenes]|uniref:Uncharacterized protein n=1 Tax=Streptomyces diastatochromogenes TaxID=42236 RepID=A0A233S703_STRDA|nr:hypothetical protein BEK98_29555 [Streptomyces diastatochromogenes]